MIEFLIAYIIFIPFFAVGVGRWLKELAPGNYQNVQGDEQLTNQEISWITSQYVVWQSKILWCSTGPGPIIWTSEWLCISLLKISKKNPLRSASKSWLSWFGSLLQSCGVWRYDWIPNFHCRSSDCGVSGIARDWGIKNGLVDSHSGICCCVWNRLDTSRYFRFELRISKWTSVPPSETGSIISGKDESSSETASALRSS